MNPLVNFRELEIWENELLLFWLTANGLSYGRKLDDSRQYTLYSQNPVNNEYSRRVEFRIVTNSEDVIKAVMDQIQSK